jgi:hypothetical protein
MNEESMKASGDLIRWLKMLSLPKWARVALALVMLLVLGCAVGLLIWGLLNSKLEVISSAVAILTVGLPISLIVLALVFGDGGANKLKDLTKLVLQKEVPDAVLQNLTSTAGETQFKGPRIVPTISGCVADYVLTANNEPASTGNVAKPVSLEFTLELNVKKANLVIWIPVLQDDTGAPSEQRLAPYQSCFFGAAKEGYVQNTTPLHGHISGRVGFVFIKTLGDDFLLNPADRLYFAQDLAFFVRGLLNVELQNA